MASTVKKIVDCVSNGRLIASYPLAYGETVGPSVPPDLIKEAKESLVLEGLVKPPFDLSGIDFRIRDGQ